MLAYVRAIGPMSDAAKLGLKSRTSTYFGPFFFFFVDSISNIGIAGLHQP